jgi:hypothetical protein
MAATPNKGLPMHGTRGMSDFAHFAAIFALMAVIYTYYLLIKNK